MLLYTLTYIGDCMNPCQGHARQQIIDECEMFLIERYKHSDFEYVKFLDIPVTDQTCNWVCQFKDKSANKMLIVSMFENELQTMTAAVLENVQLQLTNTIKEIKSVLKAM